MFRLAPLWASVAGVSWLAWELSRRAWADGSNSECASSADYFNDFTFALANVAAAATLFAFAAALTRVPRASAVAAAYGAAAQGIGNGFEHCVAEPLFLLYVLGALLFVGASLVFAASLVITGQLDRWLALFVAASAVGLMLGSERGTVLVTAIAWLAMAAWLTRREFALAPS